MNYAGYSQQQQQQYSYHQPYYPYNHQFTYYPDAHRTHRQFQPEPTPVRPPGLIPTAPEAASQRPTHAPAGPSQYSVRPFRGGDGGQFNSGGGLGLGGGRHFPSHSSQPAISDRAELPAAAAGATSVVQSLSSVLGQAPLPEQAQVTAAWSRPTPFKAWCEICKVACTSLEGLAQHKKGKQHKNKMKLRGELQKQKVINGQQSEQTATTQLNLTEQPKKVQEPEKNGRPTENMGSEVSAVNHKDETQLQNNSGDTFAVPAEEPKVRTRRNIFRVRHRGLKRKKKGGKRSKRKKTAAGPRRPVQPQITEQFIPFNCELCNVRIESESAFQIHVTGKWHLSRLMDAPGRQALSGLFGLQALYPPDMNSLSSAINAQVQRGDKDPQLLLAQLLMNALSPAQLPATASPAWANLRH